MIKQAKLITRAYGISFFVTITGTLLSCLLYTSVYTNGRLRIDFAAGCAYMGDKELHLTSTEYKLLCLMAKNTGKVLTHTYITQKVWGSSWENDIASLRVFMATLRKKLESEPDAPQYIQTHIGIGYRMIKVE